MLSQCDIISSTGARIRMVKASRLFLCAQANRTLSSKGTAKKIVVFGGNGYVGQNVCKAALSKHPDCQVISVSRSGAPKMNDKPTWLEAVKWEKGDIFDPASYAGALAGATGAVSCVGAFGSDAVMERMNGDATICAARAAKDAGVRHFVFVSTVENNLPEFFLRGYFNGKRRAEEAVLASFPEGGVVLRPSFVYGTRQAGGVSIPLWLAGKPMEQIFSLPPFQALQRKVPGMKAILAPPIPVETVAANAVAGALGEVPPGVRSVADMRALPQ